MRLALGNGLVPGILAGSSKTLTFPRTMRDEHPYVCGGTVVGKNKSIQ